MKDETNNDSKRCLERIDTDRHPKENEWWYLIYTTETSPNTTSNFYQVGRYKSLRGIDDAQQGFKAWEHTKITLYIVVAKNGWDAKRAACNFELDKLTEHKLYDEFWGTVTDRVYITPKPKEQSVPAPEVNSTMPMTDDAGIDEADVEAVVDDYAQRVRAE